MVQALPSVAVGLSTQDDAGPEKILLPDENSFEETLLVRSYSEVLRYFVCTIFFGQCCIV